MRSLAVAVLICMLGARAEAQDADAVRGARVGAAAGSCGGWGYPPDSASHLVTIDVLVPEGPSDRLDQPASDQAVERLRALGAEIVYRFTVPYVRVRIPYSRVPELEGLADHYRAVVDGERYLARVAVNYTREVSAADIAVLQSFGGAIDARMPGAVSVVLSDDAMKSLQQRAEVASIVAARVICLDM